MVRGDGIAVAKFASLVLVPEKAPAAMPFRQQLSLQAPKKHELEGKTESSSADKEAADE